MFLLMDGKSSFMYNVLECMLLDESKTPTKLPLPLLEAITNNFSNEQVIGRGGFSVVYKGMLGTGMVAVKKLSETFDIDDNKFNKEVQCLMKARHKNIVRFLGYCADTQAEMVDYQGKLIMADLRNRLLCFEFVHKGSLCDYITDASSGLEWRVRYQMIKGICEGLHYLHENRIVHLDLKPSNILLDCNMVPKIADFGISRCFDEKQSKDITSKLIGSIGYLAPESYTGQITMKLDIYSLGVIILEILTGAKGYSTIEKILESWRNRLDLSEGDAPLQQVRACAEIGVSCIDSNPDNRPISQHILQKFKELGSTDEFAEAGVSTPEAQIIGRSDRDYFLSVHPLLQPLSSSSSSLRGGGTRSSALLTKPFVPPLVVLGTQDADIPLVHTLLVCLTMSAEAIEKENFSSAEALLKVIPMVASSHCGAMRNVATYFCEALARRVYRLRPAPGCPLLDAAFADLLHAHFYESCPYLKFAHFTANQAILEAFAGCRRIHVVDLSIKQGMQWPALLQALALRPGGPPSFRLTGVGVPQPDEADVLQEVGWKVAKFAHSIGVDFQYRGLVAQSLADLEPFMLQPEGEDPDDEAEVIAVNSVFELHRLLALPGALEKVLGTVRAVRPRILTVAEQDANHNSGSFLDRFKESLHYYSTMFHSLEVAGSGQPADAYPTGTDKVMSEVYLGRQICNLVTCDGPERTERHETLGQWRHRLGRAGFKPMHLSDNAYKQASTLISLIAGGDGYRIEHKDGCLTLGWHTRPLIATSAWSISA